MASVFFCYRLSDDVSLDLLHYIHLAKLGAIRCLLFHLRHQRDARTAVFTTPIVKRGHDDTSLPAHLRYRPARFYSLERVLDLTVRELRLLCSIKLPLLEYPTVTRADCERRLH